MPGASMPILFCFIERDVMVTPHMEPLTAETEDEARTEAEALLRSHSSGIAANVFREDVRIATIRASRPGNP